MIEIRIHRGCTFTDVDNRATIERDELERALRASGVSFGPSPGDDGWWVRYPECLTTNSVGELWFAAYWRPPGYGSCVVSSTNCRIIRNAADLLEHALRIAELLGARVFTEGREVTVHNFRSFYFNFGADRVKDTWMHRVVDRWTAALARIEEEPLGAVEVPVNGLDLVPEYALIQVVPTRPVSLAEMVAELEARGESVKMSSAGIFLMSGNAIAAHMFERPDGRWQVRPGHGRVPWSRGGRALLKCARIARELSQGQAFLMGLELDPQLEREFEERLVCAVEYFLWFSERHPGRHVRPSVPPDGGEPTPDQTTAQWLESTIELARERLGEPTCRFDRATVVRLESHLRELRDTPIEDPAALTEIFGAILGRCIVETFGGSWIKIDGQLRGLGIAVQSDVLVAPWDTVEGFLMGNDSDAVVGFFDAIGQLYSRARTWGAPAVVARA